MITMTDIVKKYITVEATLKRPLSYFEFKFTTPFMQISISKKQIVFLFVSRMDNFTLTLFLSKK